MRKTARPWSAWMLSLGVHGAFLVLMLFGVQWQLKAPSAVQADLWSTLPPIAPVQDVAPPPKNPVPEPPPKPAPVEKPTPVKKPVESPRPQVKPDIVTEKMKKEKPKSPDELLKELKELDQKKQEELNLQKIDRENKEKLEREKALKELERQSQKKKELDALESERKAGQARSQQMFQGYVDKIIAKIKANTSQPPSVSGGRTVRYSFVLLPDGTVLEGSIKLVASSGSNAYDEAVSRAIIASQPLPMPDDVTLKREFRNIDLKVTSQ